MGLRSPLKRNVTKRERSKRESERERGTKREDRECLGVRETESARECVIERERERVRVRAVNTQR